MSTSTHQINQSINQFLQTVQQTTPIYVGFSGGLDSSVLLHALQSEIHQAGFQNPLIAIYVDHGLQEASAQWQEHCRQFANKLGIDYRALKVEINGTQRQGLEAIARKKRYQAFSDEIAKNCDQAILVTAHHQRDQAETLLLNLLRGSGVHGLAAMPSSKVLDLNSINCDQAVIEHKRPLLGVPYQVMLDYAQINQLDYIEDPSNQDMTFKRNFVRHKLLPQLEGNWNHVDRKLAETASYLQESVTLLEEYAELELASVEKGADFFQMPAVSVAQQKNVLRYWFKQNWPNVTLSTRHYEWVLSALESYQTSSNQSFSLQLPVGELRVYRDRVYYLQTVPGRFNHCFSGWESLNDFISGVHSGDLVSVSGETGFSFKIKPQDKSSKMILRSVDAVDRVNRKKLKAFFQNSGVPVWLRDVWPVLELDTGDQLIVLGCPECSGYDLNVDGCLELALSYRALRFLQSQNV